MSFCDDGIRFTDSVKKHHTLQKLSSTKMPGRVGKVLTTSQREL